MPKNGTFIVPKVDALAMENGLNSVCTGHPPPGYGVTGTWRLSCPHHTRESVKAALPIPPAGQPSTANASLHRDFDPAKLKSFGRGHMLIQKWLAKPEAADETVGNVYVVGGGNEQLQEAWHLPGGARQSV